MCFIFHDWEEFHIKEYYFSFVRHCRKCDKWQRASGEKWADCYAPPPHVILQPIDQWRAEYRRQQMDVWRKG